MALSILKQEFCKIVENIGRKENKYLIILCCYILFCITLNEIFRSLVIYWNQDFEPEPYQKPEIEFLTERKQEMNQKPIVLTTRKTEPKRNILFLIILNWKKDITVWI